MLQEFPALKSQEINTLFKQGKRLVFKPFLIFYSCINPNVTSVKFAITISRTIKRQVVLRNRIKRQLRQIIKHFATSTLNLHAVFLVLEDYLNLSYSEIKAICQRLFQRLETLSSSLTAKSW